MAFQPPQPPQPPGPSSSKVAIPRLERRNDPSRKPGSGNRNRRRVQRACLSCRSRKVKCNGAQPKCQNCLDNAAPCVYVSSRKDRLKTATDHNLEMMALLRDLEHRVGDADDRLRIEDMLATVTADVADAASSTLKSPDKTAPSDTDEERGEASVTAEAGSDEDLDIMDEDLQGDEQALSTGFMGKPSEIQWFRRIHYEADHAEEGVSRYNGPYGPPGDSAKAAAERQDAFEHRMDRDPTPQMATNRFNFFLDDQNIEMEFTVDPYELPAFETAEKLLGCYMTSCQNSFPILVKKPFVSQFYNYYASVGRGRPKTLPPKWQGMLNLVFAIGAAYSHLIEADWRGDERDHLVYHARACSLGLKDPWWFSNPNFPQLQISGLLGFYYLSIGHVNRSWNVTGMCLRFAYALGLHLRNEDRNATAVKKEALARIWWGLFSLENYLCAITGRPSNGLESHCSVPLPLAISAEEMDEGIIVSRFGSRPGGSSKPDHPLSGASSASPSGRGISELSEMNNEPTNSGSYLKHAAKLSIITSKVLNNVYSASTMKLSWADMQTNIAESTSQLEMWASSLPPGLNFALRNGHQGYQRERNALEMYYHSTKIIISRPCLCRIDLRIEHQSKGSDAFNKRTAEACVGAAQSIAKLLPNDIDGDHVQLYHFGLWWLIVHYIMQSVAVLLLEIVYKAAPHPRARKDIFPSLKKLLHCLRAMKSSSALAGRAYDIALGLYQKMGARIDTDITELLGEDPSTSRTSAIAPPDHNAPGPASYPGGFPPQSGGFIQSQSGSPQYQTSYPTFSDPNVAIPMEGSGTDTWEDLFRNSDPNSYSNLFVTPYDENNPFPDDIGDFDMSDYVGRD